MQLSERMWYTKVKLYSFNGYLRMLHKSLKSFLVQPRDNELFQMFFLTHPVYLYMFVPGSECRDNWSLFLYSSVYDQWNWFIWGLLSPECRYVRLTTVCAIFWAPSDTYCAEDEKMAITWIEGSFLGIWYVRVALIRWDRWVDRWVYWVLKMFLTVKMSMEKTQGMNWEKTVGRSREIKKWNMSAKTMFTRTNQWPTDQSANRK